MSMINKDLIINKKKLENNMEILVIDNFFYNIDDLKKNSENLDTKTNEDMFPGSKKYILNIKFIYDLNKELKNLDIYENKLNINNIFYGNVNKDKDLLDRDQSQPHIDIYAKKALLVYLNEDDNCHGGTGFYKNIESNKIKANTIEEGLEILKKEGGKLKKPEYISDSNNSWELIEMIPMKKNRGILYDSKIFHSAYFKNLSYFNNEGRQTLNIFLN